MSRRRRGTLLAAGAGALCLIIAIIVAVTAAGTGARHLPRSAALIGTTTGTRPLPVLYAQAEGWYGGQVRPAAIYVGQGGAPFVTTLTWSRWTVARAQASGHLHLQKPGCTRPSYECPYQQFAVSVQLSGARTHDGVRYWSQMRWSYGQDLVQRVTAWQFRGGYWHT